MCDYKVVKIERPVRNVSKVALIPREEFNKLSQENYLNVLRFTKEKLNMSKSYYYYILERLKELGLIFENAINFKAVIPFLVEDGSLKVDKSMIYVTGRYLFFMDSGSSRFSCGSCPVRALCYYGLKTVASEIGFKVKGNYTLSVLWERAITAVFNNVMSRVSSLVLDY
ncbi:MAG: hypothetical protein ASUL_09249 [Candidatus Aramenus sulfurataquae]|jgi:hypothetical protein|uniref:Uncharacterized protein n=2 Tax=Candidatus Aramenus sulfurataquae TaxID=1326980 RepID=W7KJR9_9CREN|nr:MAG: hypothetical protein ASUL_09249 [Candidatus Aramenus sulfurataquae]MCL7344297.1 hypothetical protein [Candidatus Aramenus sulfurataquae]